jgi:hypothetical protein
MSVVMDDMKRAFFTFVFPQAPQLSTLNSKLKTLNSQLSSLIRLALIMSGELPLGHGDEFGFNHLFAERGEAVNKHLAFEMVVFMLKNTCFESFQPALLFLSFLIEVVDQHAGWTLHALVDARDGETALGHGDLLVAFIQNLRIDERAEIAFVLRFVVGDDIEVDDEETDGQTHLGCGQTDALRTLEGFKHVCYEFLQIGIGLEVYFFGSLAEHGLAEDVHREYHNVML